MNYLKKIFCFLLVVTFVQSVFGQIAIVNDKDGYVNVRKSPEVKENNIADTLHNGSFVYVFDEMKKGNWANIDYHQQRCEDFCNGYIYQNRIKYISDYQSIPQILNDTDKMIFSKKNIIIKIKIREFDKSKHKITYETIDKWHFVDKIDGKKIWGTDGEMPKYEYEYISISVNGKKIFLPKEATENLYNPNINYFNQYSKENVILVSSYYDVDNDILYIKSSNSDGAGGYDVVWKIEKGKYKERAVFYGF